jgi:NET1-associated nuclear protein 1 (U3 small nucleolar RNA-associated protein 17)
MISGGSENVLVIWQMDTSKKDFLPHLAGSIENIVVSDNGASYILHLDDNSAMIISTAEMQPTTYVSGIQSAFASTSPPKDMLVKRLWDVAGHVRRPIPAIIRPRQSSKLHVCVGNGRQATMSGEFSAPLLQSFDLESFSNISKQALTRTQPTDVNISNKGFPVDDPLITNIAFSADGSWLASVDIWAPATRDVENVSNEARDQFVQERHETYLKFWSVSEGTESLALVSRINSPHATDSPATVLDLASDPARTGFATLGSDGMIRLWRPRSRQQNGIASKDDSGNEVVAWGCSQVIAVGGDPGQGAVVDFAVASASGEAMGSLAFSEDGSTMFVAYGPPGNGAVYIIDAASGEIAKTLEGMWSGSLHALQILSPFVIVLSEELRVYDIVSDELQYGIKMHQGPSSELLQLAVDQVSRKFAVSLPSQNQSVIGVFDPEEPQPLLVQSTANRVISLASAPDTAGFIAVDDAAQISVVSEGSDPTSLAAAQPLQDLHLDGPSTAMNGTGVMAGFSGEDEAMASDDEDDEAAQVTEPEDIEMDDDDDDLSAGVIPQQRLADIFDGAPAFSGASVEDMFFKVTGLLATKPLSAA